MRSLRASFLPAGSPRVEIWRICGRYIHDRLRGPNRLTPPPRICLAQGRTQARRPAVAAKVSIRGARSCADGTDMLTPQCSNSRSSSAVAAGERGSPRCLGAGEGARSAAQAAVCACGGGYQEGIEEEAYKRQLACTTVQLVSVDMPGGEEGAIGLKMLTCSLLNLTLAGCLRNPRRGPRRPLRCVPPGCRLRPCGHGRAPHLQARCSDGGQRAFLTPAPLFLCRCNASSLTWPLPRTA